MATTSKKPRRSARRPSRPQKGKRNATRPKSSLRATSKKKKVRRLAPTGRPILLIQHAMHEHPAALRRALESQGVRTHWIHPYRGDPYPKWKEIGGLISLGGPMSANDEREVPWISQEIELIRASVENELPTVGICLGGQMMAKAMGGRVERNHTAELGWFPVELNEQGRQDPIAGAAGPSPTVYHWHGDTFHLPPVAVLLGKSQACERQAYRIGKHAYGFQFHPEADHQLVLEWLEIDGVEEDIQATKDTHGSHSVQDTATQRSHALRGEKGSLKITAAIGSLFRKRKTAEVSSQVRDRIAHWIAHQESLLIEIECAGRKRIHLQGKISTLLNLAVGDFIIFQEENTLLWPIRLEDIRKISPFR